MKWSRFVLFIGLIFLVAFGLSRLFMEKFHDFEIHERINFPIDKVYHQFSNLQNLSDWNHFTEDNENLSFDFFTPYEGVGASMKYQSRKDSSVVGELMLRSAKPDSVLHYQLFRGTKNEPYNVTVKLKSVQNNATEILWMVTTPPQRRQKRDFSHLFEESFTDRVEKSIASLQKILGRKIDEKARFDAITYDSIMVEISAPELLIGANAITSNRKKLDFRESVEKENTRLLTFLTRDMNLKDDEFGDPELILRAGNRKDKEVSYFIGVPVKEKFSLYDNSFGFRTVNPGKTLVMYYQGPYEGRENAIKKLMAEAGKQNLEVGDISEKFLTIPDFDNDIILKISLQVY